MNARTGFADDLMDSRQPETDVYDREHKNVCMDDAVIVLSLSLSFSSTCRWMQKPDLVISAEYFNTYSPLMFPQLLTNKEENKG